MAMKHYDFSGWATKNDLRCSDGRTIRRDAFKQNDGKTVPLVWQHMHDSPMNVLGHALLENRDTGVYAYCTFNDTEMGQQAKELVKSGDVQHLSIYANQLKQTKTKDVLHGVIREVSLVLAGANPGACIENVALSHSDGSEEIIDEAVIWTDECVSHEEGDVEFEEAEEQDLTDDTPDATIEHADKTQPEAEGDSNMADKKNTAEKEDDKTVKEVVDSMTEEQKNVLYFLVAQAKKMDDKEDDEKDNDVKHSIEEGDSNMKYNVFEDDAQQEDVLEHSGITADALKAEIMEDLAHSSSMKETVLEHAVAYGIEDIDILFPDAKAITSTPEFLKRETAWVQAIMNGTKHIPFSRIKSVFANITENEARAKGYVKGNLKTEEVISLLKRSTDPTTIYKKQKLDRDDMLDITDFDVAAWLKGEMRIMVDEELGGAILVGDGRLASDNDKIDPSKVRPIVSESELFAVKIKVPAIVDEATAKTVIEAIIRAYKYYRGSGNKTMFIKQSALCEMLLVKDGMGHYMYPTSTALATALRVKEIVEVPDEIFERNSDVDAQFAILDLNDYCVGADKGGAVSMFDDFDIDYNQQKYLMETRCSGALVKPFSAIVGSTKVASSFLPKGALKIDKNGNPIAQSSNAEPQG